MNLKASYPRPAPEDLGNAGAAALASVDDGAAGGASDDKGADVGGDGSDGKAWFESIDGLDDETRTFLGEGKYETPASALGALRSAQKLIGGEKLPAPSEKDDISQWFKDNGERLGALKDAEAYGKALVRPEMPEGVEYDAESETALVELAVKNAWPKHITQQVLDLGTSMRLASIQAEKDRIAEDAREFNNEVNMKWGGNKDAKLAQAKRGARFLGLSEQEAAEIGDTFGSFAMVSKLAQLGEALNEDGELVGRGDSSLGLSKEQAREEIKAQNADPEIAKALQDPQHARHRELTDRRRELQKIANG